MPSLDPTTVPLSCAQKSSTKSAFRTGFSAAKVLKTVQKFKAVRKSIPRVRILPLPDGGRATRKEGAGRARSRYPTQGAAYKRARQQAIRERVEVVTHRPDGRIRDSDSFGNDPNPPRDTKH